MLSRLEIGTSITPVVPTQHARDRLGAVPGRRLVDRAPVMIVAQTRQIGQGASALVDLPPAISAFSGWSLSRRGATLVYGAFPIAPAA